MAEQPDHYKILQVDSEADPEVIQAAYRRLAQKYHPDLTPSTEAAARMASINAAWETLRDPMRRAVYDRERDAARRLIGSADSPAPNSPDRGQAPASAASYRPPTAGSSSPPFSGRGPEEMSRDWTTGRSNTGGRYEPESMRTPDALGAAGPPPGNPSGSRLNFGRYAGWSLGEIARRDMEYVEWLDRMPIGRPYRDEIDVILRRAGRRKSTSAEATERRGLFRRR